MRALIIDDCARERVAKVIAHAMDHPYIPGRSPVPGDDPCFVAELDTYRAVFTFTHIDGKVYRHLTISVPAPGMYPNPVSAFWIAELFGFTGYDHNKPDRPGPWMVDVKADEQCVAMAQEI